MKTKLTQTAAATRQLVEFGIADAKGRKIGSEISSFPVIAEEVPDDWNGCFTSLDPGDYIAVRISATRDGKSFGALQPLARFKTQAEADSATEKRLAAMRRRYEKQLA